MISSSVFTIMIIVLGMKHYMLCVQHAVINEGTFAAIDKNIYMLL